MRRFTINPIILGIMLALVAWGLYLSVGATGMFVQRSLSDPRKSGVVLACVALFLGLWVVALKARQKKATAKSLVQSPASITTRHGWNRAGVTSILVGAGGIGTWIAAVFSWHSASAYVTTVLGWSAAILMGLTAAISLVALSDRRGSRGTWLGMLGMLACVGSVIVFFARMTP